MTSECPDTKFFGHHDAWSIALMEFELSINYIKTYMSLTYYIEITLISL